MVALRTEPGDVSEPNRAWGTGRVLLLLRDDSSEDQLQFDQTREAKEVQMRS